MSSQLSFEGGSSFCINDYDAIGFDMDHTLCKYKLKALSELQYDTVVNYLVTRRNYPREIFGNHEDFSQFFQKGLIIDLERGNFLKLAEDFSILRAMHGTCVMTEEEIRLTYGTEKIWDSVTDILHGLCEGFSDPKPYWYFLDHFGIIMPYICAKIIDYEDFNLGKHSEDYAFLKDIMLCGFEIDYFHTKWKNISLYVEKCTPETLRWLKDLKSRKTVFLLTGSSIENVEHILNYIIGSDWRDFFDICLTSAMKCSFFTADKPFIHLDGNEETGELIENEIYSRGNWLQLKQFFSRVCDKDDPKVLYFGDLISYDIYAGKHLNCLDGITILEEMSAEGMVGDGAKSDDVTEVLNSKIWGSFFVDTDGGTRKRTFWSSVAMKYARLATPSVSAMSSLSLDQTITSFTFQSSTHYGGFYPGAPRVLDF